MSDNRDRVMLLASMIDLQRQTTRRYKAQVVVLNARVRNLEALLGINSPSIGGELPTTCGVCPFVGPSGCIRANRKLEGDILPEWCPLYATEGGDNE